MMNTHERAAWRRLIAFLRTCRPAGRRGRKAENWWSDFIGDVTTVAGRSGANRRHVDRRGNLVFVVTDDTDPKRPIGMRR